MAPQRDSLFLGSWWRPMARLPWWLWTLAAMVAALFLHWLAGLGGVDGGWHLIRVLAGLGQWPVPGALLLAAAVSGYRRWHGHRLHRTLAADPRALALADLGWGEFVLLVAEVFRARGYRVDEAAQIPAGGGHFLHLDGIDGHTLVLCRHWHAWRVGAAEVQELIAAMGAKGAARGVLVIPGDFTRDARRLAAGRRIELIDGAGLQALAQCPEPMPGQTIPAGRGGPQPWQWRFKWPQRRIPLRPVFRLVGTLAVAGALYGGFQWVMGLPDKRLAPPVVAEHAVARAAAILVPEPAQAPALPPPSPPPRGPGMGGVRSVQELEAAFESFYVPPPGCASPVGRADMVECANHRIRARQGFMVSGTPFEPGPGSEAGPSAESGDLVGAIPADDPAWYDPAVIEALAPPGSSAQAPQRSDRTPASGPLESVPPDAGVTPRAAEPTKRDPASTYAPYDPSALWHGR
jgi:hypothetical protein